MDSQPDVSIVVPVLDGQDWIARSLRSALAQTQRSLEVLVVDDGCVDGTVEIVGQLASRDARVRLLRTSGRAGPAAARNVALDAARGTWVAFLDADDRFHPQRLARLLAAAHQAQAVLVADNQHVLTEDGHPDGLMWPWVTQPLRVDALSWVERNVWRGPGRFGYGYAKVLVRRDLLEAPRLRMNAQLRLMEDYHFVLALLLRGHSLLLVPEPLYDYTLRSGSTTHGGTPEDVLEAVLRAGQAVLQAVEPGPLRRALALQQASVEWRAVRFRVLQQLKSHQVGAALRLLARHPAAVPYVLQSLREVVGRRVERHRLAGGLARRRPPA